MTIGPGGMITGPLLRKVLRVCRACVHMAPRFGTLVCRPSVGGARVPQGPHTF